MDYDDVQLEFDDEPLTQPSVGGGHNMLVNPVGLPNGPIGMTNVGVSGNPLPSWAPLPPSEFGNCPATVGMPENSQDFYRISAVVSREVEELEPNVDDDDRSMNRQQRRKLEQMTRDKISELSSVKFNGIGFSLVDEEITKYGIPIFNDKHENNHNTVNDPHLGTTSGTKACRTCSNTVEGCSGHYGYIKLNRYYSPTIYKNWIVSVLSCVCVTCRRLLVTMDELYKAGFWRYMDDDKNKPIIWRDTSDTRLKEIQLYIKKNKHTHECRRVVSERDRALGIQSTTTNTCMKNFEYKLIKDRINYILTTQESSGASGKSKTKKSEIPLELEQIRWFLEQIPKWEYEIKEKVEGRSIIYNVSESEYQEIEDAQNKDIIEVEQFPPNTYTAQEQTPTGIHTLVLNQQEIAMLNRRFSREQPLSNGNVEITELVRDANGISRPTTSQISATEYAAIKRIKQRKIQGSPIPWPMGVYLVKVSIPDGDGNNRIIQTLTMLPEEYQELMDIKSRKILVAKRVASDSLIMGFQGDSHPTLLVRRYIAVPPLCVRPPSTRDGVEAEDDLTQLLTGIVRRNNKVQPLTLLVDKMYQDGQLVEYFPPILQPEPEEETPAKQAAKTRRRGGRTLTKEDPVKSLWDQIHLLIFGAQANTNRKEHASIRKLMQGKQGMIRKYMTGKRGDYGGRTVISPGPEVEYGWIGLPRIFASILTQPEVVTNENKAVLMALIRAGMVTKVRPRRSFGRFITIRPGINYELQVGDIIERHLMKGDVGAGNRNPTLWMYGMMGYRVQFHDGITIRLNVNHTIFHNADFDGDEFNFFIPRTLEGIAELQSIMNARYCIQSAQENKPLTGQIFNDLTDAYNLTSTVDMVNEATYWECMEILNRPSRPSGASQLTTLSKRISKHKLHPRSGRALFSALLPADFYFNEKGVTIKDGIMTGSKPLDKGTIGPQHRSILQHIYISYGAERAALFLSDASFLLKRWSKDHPVTTGMSDCFAKRDPDTEVLPLYSIFNNETYELYETLEDIEAFKEICIETIRSHSEHAHDDTVEARINSTTREAERRHYENRQLQKAKLDAEIIQYREDIEQFRRQQAGSPNVNQSDIDQLKAKIAEAENMIAIIVKDEQVDAQRKLSRFLISTILPVDLELSIDGEHIVRLGIFMVNIGPEDRDLARRYDSDIFKKIASDYGNARAFSYRQDINMIIERCFEISPRGGAHHEMLRQNIERAKVILERHGADLADPNKAEKATKLITAQLGNMAEQVGKKILEEHLDPANNFKTIVAGAKTKGNETNIGNISGMLGLQMSGSDFVATPGASIYQAEGDLDPEVFGLVSGNFRDGSSLYEFFVHAKAARGGLVDTSIKTAEPGALTRQLVKTLEDTKVYKDQTVRMANGSIIQPMYGETRFNPERLINVEFPDGTIPFFMDVGTVVGRLNSEFYEKTDLLVQLDDEEFDIDVGTMYEDRTASIPAAAAPVALETPMPLAAPIPLAIPMSVAASLPPVSSMPVVDMPIATTVPVPVSIGTNMPTMPVMSSMPVVTSTIAPIVINPQ